MTLNNVAIPKLQILPQGQPSLLERQIVENSELIESWFSQQWQKTPPPLTSSVDLRNAGFKITPIDTNLFPAGFNNIDPELLPLCAQAMQDMMETYLPDCQNILLLPESHTRNMFYLQSLSVLKKILTDAGLTVRIGSLNPEWTEAHKMPVDGFEELLIEPIIRKDNHLSVQDFEPCLLVLNNDLSTGIPEILRKVEQTILPPASLGWDNRLKSTHFECYQQVVTELAACINIDPWLMNPFYLSVEDIDFMAVKGMDILAEKTDILLDKIRQKYQEYGIQEKPFVAVKADNGTYGMSVMMVHDGQELKALNRKQRTKMAAIKGSRKVDKIILQEGVYTQEAMANGAVAEPVIYMIGKAVVGGFYRLHQHKTEAENLNSPGMYFEPLHYDKAKDTPNRFYPYSVIARLAALAAAREQAELGV